MGDYLLKRGARFFYFRRVPVELKAFDPRPFIRISLKTTDRKLAIVKAEIYNQQIEEFWRSMVNTDGSFSEQAYRRAVALAKTHGFAYKTVADVANGPLTELIQRVLAAKGEPPEIVSAVLGGVDIPLLPISSCLEKYWPLCVDRLTRKSEHQIHKWRTPRKAAFENFVRVVGDISIDQIKRKDILAFREWWAEKISKEGMSADTANKQFKTVQDVLQTVSNGHGIDIDFSMLFSKLTFKRDNVSRPPFEADYVQGLLLDKNTFSSMNDDGKYLFYAMADTGARPSELVALKKEDIVLDDSIPYIWIRPESKRKLKTVESERKIPLVGAALYAFKNMPNGFMRYETADSAGAAINKYMREHDMLPTIDHSLYSLRHTFKDRLRDAGAPDEIMDSLMGHSSDRPKYGRGHILETKLKWLEKIAFKTP